MNLLVLERRPLATATSTSRASCSSSTAWGWTYLVIQSQVGRYSCRQFGTSAALLIE
jgi:hypothetical protein